MDASVIILCLQTSSRVGEVFLEIVISLAIFKIHILYFVIFERKNEFHLLSYRIIFKPVKVDK